jgi:hypothetical protein
MAATKTSPFRLIGSLYNHPFLYAVSPISFFALRRSINIYPGLSLSRTVVLVGAFCIIQGNSAAGSALGLGARGRRRAAL